MNKLIWDLFEMVRELMPPTHENAMRFADWARRYQLEMAAGAPSTHEAPLSMPAPEETGEDDGEPPFDPHEENELEELERGGVEARLRRGGGVAARKKRI